MGTLLNHFVGVAFIYRICTQFFQATEVNVNAKFLFVTVTAILANMDPVFESWEPRLTAVHFSAEDHINVVVFSPSQNRCYGVNYLVSLLTEIFKPT